MQRKINAITFALRSGLAVVAAVLLALARLTSFAQAEPSIRSHPDSLFQNDSPITRYVGITGATPISACPAARPRRELNLPAQSRTLLRRLNTPSPRSGVALLARRFSAVRFCA